IQIQIESRKVTARNVKTDAMPGLKYVRSGPEIDRVLVDFAGNNFRALVAVTRAHYSIGKKTRVAARIYVDKQRSEISIHCRRRCIQFKRDVTRDLGILTEGRSRKNQNIRARFIRPLIRRARRKRLPTTQTAANCRHGILWIVIKLVLSFLARRSEAQSAVAIETVRAFNR